MIDLTRVLSSEASLGYFEKEVSPFLDIYIQRGWTTRHTPQHEYEHLPFAGRYFPHILQMYIDMGYSSQ